MSAVGQSRTNAGRWSPVSIRRPGSFAPAVGDHVVVRSKHEILATLDEDGRLDGVPFMPEMFQYCGQRLQVFKSAHKTCDTVGRTGGRRLDSTVHLDDVRCDGNAHGTCDAACLIFWKTAWLRPVDQREVVPGITESVCTEAHVDAAAIVGTEDGATIYSCQATRLPEFTAPLDWSTLDQYVDDWRSGNERLRTLAAGAVYVGAHGVIRRANRPWITLGPALIRWYDRFQRLAKGVPFPRKWGSVPAGQRTPEPPPLGLQPGDFVRVKPYDEILRTLDGDNKNRGLYFDAEEVPYCGGTYRVRSHVNRIVEERSGRIIALRGSPVILENVWCLGHYSNRRMFCPRAIYSFWREAWLERVDAPA